MIHWSLGAVKFQKFVIKIKTEKESSVPESFVC